MNLYQGNLLKDRRFLPLFLTQFLGAFNDNVYKNALVILMTYTLATATSKHTEILITLAAGIFILPFFLFSAIAGQLADKFEKAMLIRYIKIAEIILTLLIGIAFYLQNIFLLITVLFLLGTQATFFGPLKYSILPDQLSNNELLAANAFIEAGTYSAILIGTITGGILATFSYGTLYVSGAVICFAILGYLTSLWIPTTKIAAPTLTINFNLFKETKNIIQHTMRHRELRVAIIGISWLWLVGATYLSQFPTYTKIILGADAAIVTLFLTVFTIGIGIGSLLCNLLKNSLSKKYITLAALGMALFSIDLVLASRHMSVQSQSLLTLLEFLTHWQNWRILWDLLLLSVCGGLYVVPLYVILQSASQAAYRSRAVACNNILNAFFMVVAAIIASIMLSLNFQVTDVFLTVAIANIFMTIYLLRSSKNNERI